MAKISTYSVVNPEGDDKIIISESSGNPSNVTKNVTVDGLKTFIVNGLPVPTLQEVTTSGNTTTKNITTQGIKSEGTRDIDLVVKVGDYDGSGAKTKLEVDVENKIVSVDSDILRLTKLGGTRTDITFNPTATRLIAMPDASGTIALTSDLPSASPWNPDTNGINYQAGNVGIGTASTNGDALTVDGQIKSTNIETSGILVEGNATIDDNLSVSGDITATNIEATNKVVSPTFLGELLGTVALTTTGITQPSITNNNLLATTAFVQDLLGNVVGGLQFQELWDASSDIPNLSTATPNNGDFWIVKVAGTTNLSGITNWFVGDWAIYIVPSGGGTAFWQKVDNTTSISGTGTGNQVAKWSGVGASTTLTDSIITSTATAVGINVLAPVAALEVGGEIIAQSLDIQTGALVQGSLTVDNSATITQDLAVGGNAAVTGALSAGGLAIGGNAAVTGTLNVGGTTTLNGSLEVTGAYVEFDGELSVTGTSGFTGGFTSGNSGTINGELTVTDEVFLQDNLNVTGVIFLTSDLLSKITTNASGFVNILGDSAVSLDSGDGLKFSVSDVFEFKGSTGISLYNGNSSALNAFLDVSQITTSRTFQFPDNSGTVALLSDLPATTGPSEWVGQIGVDLFGVPEIDRTQTSTLFVGDRVTTPDTFRDITFTKDADGEYRLRVTYTPSTVPTDRDKLALQFGDNVARVYSYTLGSQTSGGITTEFKEFLFRTYTPAGVVSAGQLLGQQAASTSVILYP
tara:strand:+ start:1152 stop:3389 length:2238 start_codon:yes stop_codon:yes gene_type:complete